ncbi:MAG: cob(I)yrinic acid a,c-diamide adenosyltransferase [Myxococcales bacterium]|nr:cob(I)yrinic acid a,c-diamide adenosyltransferase [Myxococcales bacterium]
MKIYTKTGDRGQTGLFGGARVSKASARVAAYGDVDELNSVLGAARAADLPARLDDEIHRIQSELFALGAELARVPGKDVDLGVDLIADGHIAALESTIDELEQGLPPLKTFILPGGSPGASTLHVARTVCRRAERGVIQLADAEPVREELVRYLNRLSDLIFVMARSANASAGVGDVPWLGRDSAP